MDEEMLINLVRAHKELYDLNDPQYDVRPKRDSAWQQIGAAMNKSPRDCRDQWKRIRDCYRRAQKLRRMKCIQGAKIIKRPKYEALLSFLNPYLRDRLDKDAPPHSGLKRAAHCAPPRSSDEDSEPEPPSPAASSRGSPPAHCVEPALLPAPAAPPLPHRDKITDFFMGLVETVKEFPENVQIRVKRDIFKVVSDAEELVYKMKSERQLDGLRVVKSDLD